MLVMYNLINLSFAGVISALILILICYIVGLSVIWIRCVEVEKPTLATPRESFLHPRFKWHWIVSRAFGHLAH